MCHIVIEWDQKKIYRITTNSPDAQVVLLDNDKSKVIQMQIIVDCEKTEDIIELAGLITAEAKKTTIH